jgi:hypothetical protein
VEMIDLYLIAVIAFGFGFLFRGLFDGEGM